jgi:HAMP domain-containing protein
MNLRTTAKQLATPVATPTSSLPATPTPTTPTQATTPTSKRALGFIISNDRLIIGYISKNGAFCKVASPVDLNSLSSEQFNKLIGAIPIVHGFSESARIKLISLISNEELMHQLQTVKSEYDLYVKKKANDTDAQIVKIKKEHVDEIQKINDQFSTCKDRILHEKDIIIERIKEFQQRVDEHIRSQIIRNENLQETVKKLTAEKAEIESTLKQVQEREQQSLERLQQDQDALTDYSYQMNSKNEEIDHLNKTIEEIRKELNVVTSKLTASEIRNQQLNICIEKILNEKETIIEAIKEYNQSWLEWARTNNYNISEYKRKIQNDLATVYNQLRGLLHVNNRRLKQNIIEIKNELERAVSKQLLEMSLKQEREKQIEQQEHLVRERDIEIANLKSQLDEIKMLLEKSRAATELASANVATANVAPGNVAASNVAPSVTAAGQINISVCYDILKKFIAINNSFYKRKEVISKLDKIIFDQETFSNFTNLSDAIKKDIRERYTQIRDNINKHIQFLDLNRYVSNPNVEFFKSQSTVQKVDPQFCRDLDTINQYWQENVQVYNEQDFQLMNIYEDLSGAIRIYVKIKPLLGIQQKNDTVIVNKKDTSITVDCSNVPSFDRDIKKEVFSNFNGIFDESFNNAEVFTGIPGAVANSEFKFDEPSATGSLQNAFAQVRDGYSIVLFGYGTSGSGKTRLLLGESDVPGLIHYALSNLTGVENIRIKNIFEQGIDRFQPTLKLITSRIHHLVNRLPSDLNKFSVDESVNFDEYHNLDLNNITSDNLDSLMNSITRYRLDHRHIRKTPNNPVSSRTHLYIVFEIKFDTGRMGYITFIDMAGKESPLDIFDTFMDQSGRYKPNLTSILGPTGGPGRIVVKPDLDYSPETVYDILKEGIYINETIGHLNYFFHKKNYKKYKIAGQSDLDHYSPSKFYVDPREEETRIATNNNVLMIPILKYLDSLSKSTEFKPTKFITMICIRKDEEYCGQIFDSLSTFN